MKGKIITILVMTLLIGTVIPAVGIMNIEKNNVVKSSNATTIVWSENFDSYAAGSLLHGQGGWEAWDLKTEYSPYVSDEQSHSTPNSVELNYNDTLSSDIVHMFYGINAGLWNLNCWHYVPNDMEGHSAIALFNTYAHGGSHGLEDVMTVLCAHTDLGYIHNPITGAELPIITDEWVEINIEIDFDQEIVTFYYNGTLFESISLDGHKNLACINIYNSDYWSNASYFDDFTLEGDVSETADLYCEGELKWTGITPGDIVTGSLVVQNIGTPSTLLDWEIAETPEWGDWSFEPNNGTDLEGWSPIIIDVEVVAPTEENIFTGDIKIVNSEDPDDFEIIPVRLNTPRNKVIQNTIFLRLLEQFPFFQRLLQQLGQ